MFSRQLLLKSSRQNFLRSEKYGFGPARPQSNWHKYREKEILAGTPPNDFAKYSPIPWNYALYGSFVVGISLPFIWANSRRTPPTS